MEIYKNNLRIKFFLFLITLLCSILFFSINLYLVNQFRYELNKQVKTIVNIYHDKLTNEEVDSEYLLKTLLPLIDDLDIVMSINNEELYEEKPYKNKHNYYIYNILINLCSW